MSKRFPLLLPAAFAAALAFAAPPAQEAFVSVRDASLRVGGEPVSFACAAEVPLPSPEEGEDPAAACDRLARRLALSGFNMVRLPRAAAPSAAGGPDLRDFFVRSCARQGVRIWAEAMQGLWDAPVPAEAVDLVDDPSTRAAWTNALAAAAPEDLALAAFWDPRLEVLALRRQRDWARAFNGETGLRRGEDPAYGFFSLSSTWWTDIQRRSPDDLPAFFAQELRTAWNDWLFSRYGTDTELDVWLGLLPGETLVSNTVAMVPFDSTEPSLEGRRKEQLRFLRAVCDDHLRRLLDPFPAFGPATRLAPRAVSDGSDGGFLDAFSTAALFSRRAGVRRDRPLVFDAASAASPDEAAALAGDAVRSGADLFVLPCGDAPETWSRAALSFRAGRSAPESARRRLRTDAPVLDLPGLGLARVDLAPAEDRLPEDLLFPSVDAAVTLLRIPRKSIPSFPASFATNASVRFLVCVASRSRSPAGTDPATATATGTDPATAAATGTDPATAAAVGTDPATAAAAGTDPAAATAAGTDPATGTEEAVPGADSPLEADRPLKLSVAVRRPAGTDPIALFSIEDAETGEPVSFAVIAQGQALSKKVCVRSFAGRDSEPFDAVDGVFRAKFYEGRGALVFQPAPLGRAVLRTLE